MHHANSWLKLSFYRSIQIYRVDFEKIYIISSMLFFFFFLFFRTPVGYAVRDEERQRPLCVSEYNTNV